MQSTRTNPERLLSTAEVAARLGLTRHAIQHGSLRRELPWVKLPRDLRLRSADLDAYLAARTERPRAA